jgi:signal transduction histidine kinase/ActR/RegA family two-component response regulator
MSTPDPTLPRHTNWLRPLVDAVARIRASVHRKLLFGFLIGAVLLVAMAALSVVVLNQMNSRVNDLERHQVKADRARQMLYLVTAQSHYRAMALLTEDATPWNSKIATAKATFVDLLDAMERDDPEDMATFAKLRSDNDTYTAASARVLSEFQNGEYQLAQDDHIAHEHEISHLLEDRLNPFIEDAEIEMANARADVATDRTLLTWIVVAFSGLSVLLALMLGYLMSWSFILPVKKIQHALSEMAAGRFRQHVDVVNRDEFGSLTRDLNTTSDKMATLFEEERVLAQQLSDTNESLERASEAKSRFLASVSHELRTPMNAILGFTDALLAGVDGPLNEEQKTSLGWVQRGGRDLLGLINEILDLSKIEAGRLEISPEPFDFRELVDSVVSMHRSLATQKGITISSTQQDMPAEVVLDTQRVRQILVNLLGNAIKFSDSGEVAVETQGTPDQSVRVSVRDSGPGIPAAELETIFEEFGQGAGARHGTGLGLAISRRLARAMGGDITVSSTLGRGSTFTVDLPVDCRTGPRTTPAAAHDGMPLGERVVLSVDDDPSVSHLFTKMLHGHGYRVVATTDSDSALTEARRINPDAILLDLLMPDVDGYEILRRLKADPATRDIPVVVISVVDTADTADTAHKADTVNTTDTADAADATGSAHPPLAADARLQKPVQQNDLLQALEELTGTARIDV